MSAPISIGFLGSGTGEHTEITSVEVEEAVEIVKHIAEYHQKRPESDSEAMRSLADSRQSLGLLMAYTGDLQTGKDYLTEALAGYRIGLGDDHAKSKLCDVAPGGGVSFKC